MTKEEMIVKEVHEYGLDYKRLAKIIGLYPSTVSILLKAMLFDPVSFRAETDNVPFEVLHAKQIWRSLGTQQRRYVIAAVNAVMNIDK